jgi:hypothetical protein
MKWFAIIIVFVALSGCMSFVDVKKSDQILKHDISFDKNYTVGSINEKYVGDDILTIQKVEVSEYNAYITLTPFDYPMKVAEGVYFNVCGETANGFIVVNQSLTERVNEREARRYALAGVNHSFNNFGLEITPEGVILGSVWLGKKPYYRPNDIGEVTPEGKLFERKNKVVRKESKYKFKVVYQGISGNIIKLQYEEYVDGLARDAFFKTFEYDLSNGKEIAVKGIIIEIVDANNSTIKYKVVDDSKAYRWVQ